MNKTPILKTYRVPRVLQIRSVRSSSLSDVATQQTINVQILSQLSSISDRLNILEKKDAKKNSDPKKNSAVRKKVSSNVAPVTLPQHQCPTVAMPSLQSIRKDAFIQSQVDQRLKELHNLTTQVQKLNL